MNLKDFLIIKRATDSLGEGELKPYLQFMLAKIKLVKQQEGTSETLAHELIKLYDELKGLQERKVFWSPVPNCTHVHIVIGESFAGSMKQALRGLGLEETHKVISLQENYAIGPLGLDLAEGRMERRNWFSNNIIGGLEEYDEFENEYNEILAKLDLIPKGAEIVVWTSSNACEQIGLRHAVHLLRSKPNSISLYDACSVCEELYNRPDAFIHYMCSGEIPSEKLREAISRLDDKKRLDSTDVARLDKEWKVITEQSGTLRIWRDEAVLEVPADYYDEYLLEKLDDLKPLGGDEGYLKSSRLIGEAIGNCEQFIGDAYFEYRLRELIYKGVLEIKGVPAGMRFYSIRRK
ncbi:DUF1835 domain-containing protein [Paenibacillus illinoisensis]|uniref:DUF1835 domain-containing protein n=1 Tax=Paenibacillus illinoisensis TaxID=59845 RepID=UPI00203FA9C8|nr:DUF1835 domain-containing protein [Paenibacillus illinoisensis]MCM3203384.1 DUF1835 domain-containing protein [Paenibacillus illinoisensis]